MTPTYLTRPVASRGNDPSVSDPQRREAMNHHVSDPLRHAELTHLYLTPYVENERAVNN